MRDFYKVLGIASTADDKRIKSAFRRRAKAFHPDLNPGDRRAEERFKELTQAYEVLRSAHARACYDAIRAHERGEARRRFAGSAALMAASFLLTLGSAYAVLSLQDGGNPFREGWQLAMSLTRVADKTTAATAQRPGSDAEAGEHVVAIAVASAAPLPVEMRISATEVAKSLSAQTEVTVPVSGAAAVPGPQQPAVVDGDAGGGKTASARRHKPAQEVVRYSQAQKKLAAATSAPRRHPAAARREPVAETVVPVVQTGRPWPAADEPFMALGAVSRH